MASSKWEKKMAGTNPSALIYDLEIIRAIPGKQPLPIDIDVCEGWHDHKNMGISVLCAYDYLENRYRVFMEDNIEEFFRLCVERQVLIGFNNIHFDNKVLNANKTHCGALPPIFDEKCYDILREVWAGAGLGPEFRYPSHAGYGLNDICVRNQLGRKTGDGSLAPILWQRGERGKVIDYCLNDILLTRRLTDLILAQGYIVSPKNDRVLDIKPPSVLM